MRDYAFSIIVNVIDVTDSISAFYYDIYDLLNRERNPIDIIDHTYCSVTKSGYFLV